MGRQRVVRGALASIIGMAAVAAVAGCSAGGPRQDGDVVVDGVRCGDADRAVVSEVMRQARSDFSVNGDRGVRVGEIRFRRARTVELEPADRRFGATRVLGLLTEDTFEGDTGDLAGAEGAYFFALDAQGQVLGPVDSLTKASFTVPEPQIKGWSAWGSSIERTSIDAFGCLKPEMYDG